MTKQVKWIQKTIDCSMEQTMIDNGIHRLIARMLSQRKIENVETFLEAKYQHLSDPFSMHGMTNAVDCFLTHIEGKSKIVVVGDYDADGIVSCSMLFELCRNLLNNCDIFLPSRFRHGYGLSHAIIDDIFEKYKIPPDLVMMVDCGINSREQIERLKKNGVKDVIVIDHHLFDEKNLSSNASAIINWHLGCLKNNEGMCAAGEVFQFIRGLSTKNKKIKPIEFLTYASIATVADQCPIIGDNRIIVKNGLTRYAITHVGPLGFQNLLQKCRLNVDSLSQEDISFKIAPRLNAPGRLTSPQLSFELMTEYDSFVADDLANEIDSINKQRKTIQKNISNDAILTMKNMDTTNGVAMVDEKWHVGVVGIVASRVVEECARPSLIAGKLGDKWKGSGRSVHGINLKKIMDDISYVFETYGGHQYAAGFTLKDEYVSNIHEIFSNACKNYYEKNKIDFQTVKHYDAVLKIKAVNDNNASVLSKHLSPYCNEFNPEPIFLLSNVEVVDVQFREGDIWSVSTCVVMKDNIKSPQIKFFSTKFTNSLIGQHVDIYFTFPQTWDEEDMYRKFSLNGVSMVLKKEKL